MDNWSTEAAIAFYQDVTDPTARAVMDFLIDHPDERLNGAAIVQHLGLAQHSDVARSTYLMGRTAAEHGLQRPWTEGQHGYLMPSQQADVLRRAREQTGNPSGS